MLAVYFHPSVGPRRSGWAPVDDDGSFLRSGSPRAMWKAHVRGTWLEAELPYREFLRQLLEDGEVQGLCIAAFDAPPRRFALASIKEAKKRIAEGESPEGLVHFIDDRPSRGLSSAITHEEWVRGGYTSRYYTLREIAAA